MKQRMIKCLAVCLGILFSLLVVILQPVWAAELNTVRMAEEIKAKSAILMDENGIVLFEKDSHKPLPPASVTKVMTILLAVEAVESGKVQLTDTVTASENAWKQGGSQIWLEKGETLSFREMLIALAVVSANDTAVALMEHVYGSESAGVDAMNRRAQELGLANTHFSNVNGLSADNHYLSTYDTALIVREATKHSLYMEVCGMKEYWLRNGKNWLVNTNKLLWWYSGADGLKTGWTDAAQYCFAGTAKRDGLRLISVVFAAPEPRSHLKESMKLLDWGFANYKALPAVQGDEIVTRVKVHRGSEAFVNLVAKEALNVLVAKGEDKEIEKQYVLEKCSAPVKAGDKYGEMVVLKGGKECGRVDLVAENDVERADFLQILRSVTTDFFVL